MLAIDRAITSLQLIADRLELLVDGDPGSFNAGVERVTDDLREIIEHLKGPA